MTSSTRTTTIRLVLLVTVVQLITASTDCHEPPEIQDATRNQTNGSKFGSKTTYTCYPGYKPTNTGAEFTSTCQADGTWSIVTQTCERIDCTEPTVIPNSDVKQTDGTKFESNATYTCKPGYTNTSTEWEATSMCQANGNWTIVTLSCELKQQSIEYIRDMKMIPGQTARMCRLSWLYIGPHLPADLTVVINPDDVKTNSFVISWTHVYDLSVYGTIDPPTQTSVTDFETTSPYKPVEHLRSGTKYTVCIYVVKDSARSKECRDNSSYTVPEVVPEPTVTNISETGFTVTWDSSKHCEQYEVNVSSTEEKQSVTVPRENKTTSYTFTNLTGGNNYTISVKSMAGKFNSTNTLTSQFTLPEVVPEPTVTNISETGFTVTWESSKHCEQYEVSASSTEEKQSVTVPRENRITSYTFTNLTGGNNYTISVKAMAGKFNSTHRLISQFTRPPRLANVSTESYPTSLKMTMTYTGPNMNLLRYCLDLPSSSTIDVTEENPVYRCDKPSIYDETTKTPVCVSAKEFNILNLTSATTYTFHVYTCLDGLGSEQSFPVVKMTSPELPADLTVNINPNDVKTNRFTMSWYHVYGLSVYGTIDPPTQTNESDFTSTAPYKNFEHLRSGTKYTVCIYVVKDGARSNECRNSSSYTVPEAVPEPTVTNISETGFTVTWDSSKKCEQYEVSVSSTEEKRSVTVPRENKTTSYTFTNLTGGNNYTISVIAMAGKFNSTNTLTSQFTRPQRLANVSTESYTTSLKMTMTYAGPNINILRYCLDLPSSSTINVTEENPVYQCDKPSISDETPKTVVCVAAKEFSILNLTSATKYTFHVYTCLDGLGSEHSFPVMKMTRPDNSITIEVTEWEETTLKLRWSTVQEYVNVSLSIAPVADDKGGSQKVLVGRNGTYLFEKLNPGTEYNISAYTVMATLYSETAVSVITYTRPLRTNIMNVTKFEDKLQFTFNRSVYFNMLRVNIATSEGKDNKTIVYTLEEKESTVEITNLTAGTRYNATIVTLIHTDSGYIESRSITEEHTFTLLAPPKEAEFPLSKIHKDSFTVHISDPAVGGHDGYCVIVVEPANPDQHKCTNTSEVTFSNLTAGTLYKMSVYSRWLNEQGSMPLPASVHTRPTIPNKVIISNIEETKFTIDVQDKTWSHYSFIVMHGSENTTNITVAKEELPTTVPNLQNGTLYTMLVYSIVAGLSSEASKNISSFTKPGWVNGIEGVPENTTASDLHVQWNMPYRHYDFFRYNATCTNPNALSSLGPIVSQTSKTNAKLTHLDPGTACNITVTVVINNIGTGDELQGKPVTVKIDITTRETVPGVPMQVHIADKTSTTIKLVWKSPAERNGIIRNYTVEYKYAKNHCYNEGSTQTKHVTTEGAINEINLTEEDIYPFWSYKITVQATNNIGTGKRSEVVDVKTLQHVPGTIVNDTVKADPVDGFHVNISWSQPCLANGIITAYKLCLTNDSSVAHGQIEWKNCQVTNNTAVMNRMDTFPYRNYSFSVSAINSAGIGNMSDPIAIKAPAARPEVPSALMLKGISSDTIRVSWNKPTLFYGPVKYFVQAVDAVDTIITSSSTSSVAYWKDTVVTSLDVKNLDALRTYNVTVYAITGGFNVPSQSRQCTTAGPRPGPVSQILLIPENDVKKARSIIVLWKPPEKIYLNGVLVQYHINLTQLNGKKEMFRFATVTNKTSHTFLNIPPGDYKVSVYAATKVGIGTVLSNDTHVEAGAPLKAPETNGQLLMQEATQSVGNKKTQIRIALPKKAFLCNSSNGDPVEWGLVVAQENTAKDASFNGNKADFERRINDVYKNWSDVKDEPSFSPYIATPAAWNPCSFSGGARKRRSTVETQTFVIGEEGQCAGRCNGALKPGRQYRVKSYVCTVTGCTETLYSKPIATGTSDPDSTPLSTAVGISLAVVILIGIGIVVFVLWRMKKGCFAKDMRDPLMHKCGDDINLQKIKARTEAVFRPGSVKLTDLPDRVEEMHRNSDLLFVDGFEVLKAQSPNHPTTAAKQQCCRPKNRNKNILPFDHSRVKLRTLNNMEGSDYINANFIPGYIFRREYIATQGPMQGTFNDFWRMVWEHNVDTIVMLTQLIEKDQNKGDKYWPDLGKSSVYGGLEVSMLSGSNVSDYIMRNFEVKMKMESRVVRHFSYIQWPDMGCPHAPEQLLDFVKAVRRYTNRGEKAAGPIIVHCSNGAGRTGTFIAVDYLLQHIRDHDEVDVNNLILEMRNHRINMVQTEDQYVYIHDCVKAFILRGEHAKNKEDETHLNNRYCMYSMSRLKTEHQEKHRYGHDESGRRTNIKHSSFPVQRIEHLTCELYMNVNEHEEHIYESLQL